MRIIIAGAGELGRLLASTLSNAAHDVTIIDSDADMLEHINDNLDIKVVEGSCISINTLKDAGIKTADALLAVSGDEAANILCCQLASKMGVLKTVCRLSSPDRFSEDDYRRQGGPDVEVDGKGQSGASFHVYSEGGFGQFQLSAGRHGQEFRQSLDDAQKDRLP